MPVPVNVNEGVPVLPVSVTVMSLAVKGHGMMVGAPGQSTELLIVKVTAPLTGVKVEPTPPTGVTSRRTGGMSAENCCKMAFP